MWPRPIDDEGHLANGGEVGDGDGDSDGDGDGDEGPVFVPPSDMVKESTCDGCAAGNTCIAGESLPDCDGDSCSWLQPPWFEEGTAPPGLEHIGVCVSI
jgi:hypothetical protein